jgi:hypothetical protein
MQSRMTAPGERLSLGRYPDNTCGRSRWSLAARRIEASTAVLGAQQGGKESEAPSATHRKVRIAQKGTGGGEKPHGAVRIAAE